MSFGRSALPSSLSASPLPATISFQELIEHYFRRKAHEAALIPGAVSQLSDQFKTVQIAKWEAWFNDKKVDSSVVAWRSELEKLIGFRLTNSIDHDQIKQMWARGNILLSSVKRSMSANYATLLMQPANSAAIKYMEELRKSIASRLGAETVQAGKQEPKVEDTQLLDDLEKFENGAAILLGSILFQASQNRAEILEKLERLGMGDVEYFEFTSADEYTVVVLISLVATALVVWMLLFFTESYGVAVAHWIANLSRGSLEGSKSTIVNMTEITSRLQFSAINAFIIYAVAFIFAASWRNSSLKERGWSDTFAFRLKYALTAGLVASLVAATLIMIISGTGFDVLLASGLFNIPVAILAVWIFAMQSSAASETPYHEPEDQFVCEIETHEREAGAGSAGALSLTKLSALGAMRRLVSRTESLSKRVNPITVRHIGFAVFFAFVFGVATEYANVVITSKAVFSAVEDQFGKAGLAYGRASESQGPQTNKKAPTDVQPTKAEAGRPQKPSAEPPQAKAIIATAEDLNNASGSRAVKAISDVKNEALKRENDEVGGRMNGTLSALTFGFKQYWPAFIPNVKETDKIEDIISDVSLFCITVHKWLENIREMDPNSTQKSRKSDGDMHYAIAERISNIDSKKEGTIAAKSDKDVASKEANTGTATGNKDNTQEFEYACLELKLDTLMKGFPQGLSTSAPDFPNYMNATTNSLDVLYNNLNHYRDLGKKGPYFDVVVFQVMVAMIFALCMSFCFSTAVRRGRVLQLHGFMERDGRQILNRFKLETEKQFGTSVVGKDDSWLYKKNPILGITPIEALWYQKYKAKLKSIWEAESKEAE